MTDPYEVLGVKRDASQKDIQASYRRLAKKLHPDLNPGDKSAEQKFKELSAAYDLVGDSEKRARFDRGEIDASGAERPARSYYRDFATAGSDGGETYRNAAGYADFADGDDVFAEFFGRRGGRNIRMRGADVRYLLEIDFLEAVNGATKRVTLPDGGTLDLVVPPGAHDGQILRLSGKGGAGVGGGSPGDALFEIAVRPHPFFVRDGYDIRVELPISLTEAVQGGKVRAPTPSGLVTVTIPRWSNTGKVLRLKGKGVPRRQGSRGDEYVVLRIVLPDQRDEELERFVATWEAGKAHNPRQHMGIKDA